MNDQPFLGLFGDGVHQRVLLEFVASDDVELNIDGIVEVTECSRADVLNAINNLVMDGVVKFIANTNRFMLNSRHPLTIIIQKLNDDLSMYVASEELRRMK